LVQVINPAVVTFGAVPVLSDRSNGHRSDYHFVVATPPDITNALVDLEVIPDIANNGVGYDIGMMEKMSGVDGGWQFDWDIPSTFKEGPAILRAHLYQQTFDGFEELGFDEVAVDLQHLNLPDPVPADAAETVSIVSPGPEGSLGFFRPSVGAWRTVVSGFTGAGATAVRTFYSTSDLASTETRWIPCGSSLAGETLRAATGGLRFDTTCTILATDVPSAITAVTAMAFKRGVTTASGAEAPQGSDASIIKPYLQDPEKMQIAFSTSYRRTLVGGSCATVTATVTDQLGQPVQGANVDLEARGPSDATRIAADMHTAPDRGGFHTEQVPPCPNPLATIQAATQPPAKEGVRRLPGQADIKHIETKAGTGLTILVDLPGQVSFNVLSPLKGFTDLTAWIDDEDLAAETDQRPLDSDTLDPGEPFSKATAQWLEATPTISFDSAGATGGTGGCIPYTLKSRSANAPVPGANLDITATSKEKIRFCDPGGGNPVRSVEDNGDVRHIEGEADDLGNFVFGIASETSGNATMSAWIDGEKGEDDDKFGGTEPAASASATFLKAGEPVVSIISPSDYGPSSPGGGSGLTVSNTRDADTAFRFVTRVDGMAPQGVELSLSPDQGKTFNSIGVAKAIPGTDTFELEWEQGTMAGAFVLRAAVVGQPDAFVDQPISISGGQETVSLAAPKEGSQVGFDRGATQVRGVASAGAEGIDLYYSKTAAKDTPKKSDWVFCGYADLGGTTSAQQPFEASCRLQAPDQPSQVTGIAAIAFDCAMQSGNGCDANPKPPPLAPGVNSMRSFGGKESGDAVRVYGYESHPVIAFDPYESMPTTNSCELVELVLRDQTGQPIAHQNVDIQISKDAICPVEGGSEIQRSSAESTPSEGTRVEGVTGPRGALIVGLVSGEEVDIQLLGWLDRSDDDLQTSDEPSTTAIVHFRRPVICTINGTNKDDVLVGTAGDDKICGGAGDDEIRGGAGNDILIGGGGRDGLFGEEGDDELTGGVGRDELDGGSGVNACRGRGDRVRACG
jgi:hypothetical protein